MERIRILQVGLDTNLGGIETYLMKIASNCDRTRFQLDFLAFDGNRPCFYEELTALGCNFHFIRSRRTSPIGSRKDLKRLLTNERYDIVQCNLNSLTYIAPVLEGLRSGSKVIALSHNAGSGFGSSSKILCKINSFIFPYSDVCLVACSEKAGQWMFGKNHPFQILNNGIDASLFRFSSQTRDEVRKEFGISGDREVLLHVGAFRPQKNHAFLLDVFSAYQKQQPEALLLLAGGGELTEQIHWKAKSLGVENNILFLGKRSDIGRILCSADKFVFPSLYEGFPISMLEAQANGLRCIASSEITNEVFLDNSIAVGLDEPISKWVSAIAEPNRKDRESAWQDVEKAGLGIQSDIRRLEDLYISLVQGK